MKLVDAYRIIRTDYRCSNCHRLLFKGKLKQGSSIQIVCPKCKSVVEFNIYSKIDKK